MNAAGPARRVVSLVPSLTETLLGWGVRPAAVTRFCEVDGYPTVGGTKNPDIRAIVDLAPDVVLMDREENRRPDAEALMAAGVRVLAVQVRSVGDVRPALDAVAAAIGVIPATAGCDPVPARSSRPVPVWVPIWRRPWMTIGAATYGSSILAAAGFRNVYGDCAEPYPTVEPAAARALGPELVLAPSEPYAFKEKHRAELEQVAPAVFVDGKDLFWWGVRTPGAQRRLAQLAAELARR
ncbi:MAG TPA: helical backbone metal receptor [Acidimicrobiales bacterium]|nr:helical backbone metal receptor [Acidimicrobiales bacterium]